MLAAVELGVLALFSTSDILFFLRSLAVSLIFAGCVLLRARCVTLELCCRVTLVAIAFRATMWLAAKVLYVPLWTHYNDGTNMGVFVASCVCFALLILASCLVCKRGALRSTIAFTLNWLSESSESSLPPIYYLIGC